MFKTFSTPSKLLFGFSLLGTALVGYATAVSWSSGQPNPIIVGAIVTLLAGPALMIHTAYDMKHPTVYHVSCALCAVGCIYMLLNAMLHSNVVPRPTLPPGKTPPPAPPLWKHMPSGLQRGLEQSVVYVSLSASAIFVITAIILLRIGPPDPVSWGEFRRRRRINR
eukprot:Gregarina_sp_Poly_1__1618@NODE_140_length_13084_cov_215_910194_g125_i0_p7_GENE_NODE_140_length_13084_cov_215_910194_g125_i0NODE_140_length_13084_cov_215_910194_g125_i0_p7_ORF_typecomplete_len166_score18_51Frag1/PF10277_9/0_00019DUF4282/PF14110_6/20DUF4282/PF14110_6/0_043Ndc1_Nup/PF09531_10/0_0064Sugar_transport/PF06800_12/0_039DUF5518/PF17647_1/0_047DUF5518/PF17647_1/8_6e02ThrE/PF06738_12/1_8ThrE/PF06738_12/1_3e03ThrE/PF06738_12/2_3e02DUF998/PF06197_13/23MFS_1/PF07690_16/1_6MFS_1/PF07690_16/2_1e